MGGKLGRSLPTAVGNRIRNCVKDKGLKGRAKWIRYVWENERGEMSRVNSKEGAVTQSQGREMVSVRTEEMIEMQWNVMGFRSSGSNS